MKPTCGNNYPRGISDAAMWWESDQKQIIWRPHFKFAGVCTACYKRGTVVQVVKASVVRRFLEKVFDPQHNTAKSNRTMWWAAVARSSPSGCIAGVPQQ